MSDEGWSLVKRLRSELFGGGALELDAADHIDALESQLADLRRHLGTLTPGGSHTCITCAAHCVVIEDLIGERDKLAESLRKIVAWDLPKVINRDGEYVSYSWAYGSNGERDFIRKIATDVLTVCGLSDREGK